MKVRQPEIQPKRKVPLGSGDPMVSDKARDGFVMTGDEKKVHVKKENRPKVVPMDCLPRQNGKNCLSWPVAQASYLLEVFAGHGGLTARVARDGGRVMQCLSLGSRAAHTFSPYVRFMQVLQRLSWSSRAAHAFLPCARFKLDVSFSI